MLDYEWGNPSNIMYTGDDSTQDAAAQNRQLFDPYGTQNNFGQPTGALINPNVHYSAAANHHSGNPFHHQHDHHQGQSSNAQFCPIFDPRAAYGASSYNPLHHHHGSILSHESSGPTGFMVIPKSEPVVGGHQDFTAAGGRIGLNLGGRTYFSSSEDDFVSRLYRRSRLVEPSPVNSPRCQAEGCNADLTNAKHYHRRHKVCEFHSKAATVIASGLTQRFCQQCSRFHLLSEFDNGKRSCRKRLADHNRRRRKSQQQQQSNQEQCNTGKKKSPSHYSRSPPDSAAHSSSVTIAVSPPRISLDCFGQRSPYEGAAGHGCTAATANSSASTNSLFFSDE